MIKYKEKLYKRHQMPKNKLDRFTIIHLTSLTDRSQSYCGPFYRVPDLNLF